MGSAELTVRHSESRLSQLDTVGLGVEGIMRKVTTQLVRGCTFWKRNSHSSERRVARLLGREMSSNST